MTFGAYALNYTLGCIFFTTIGESLFTHMGGFLVFDNYICSGEGGGGGINNTLLSL